MHPPLLSPSYCLRLFLPHLSYPSPLSLPKRLLPLSQAPTWAGI
jgi:hypothetical protein